jgi:hypothetical protein
MCVCVLEYMHTQVYIHTCIHYIQKYTTYIHNRNLEVLDLGQRPAVLTESFVVLLSPYRQVRTETGGRPGKANNRRPLKTIFFKHLFNIYFFGAERN